MCVEINTDLWDLRTPWKSSEDRFLDHLPRDCNYVGLDWVLRVFFLSKLTGDADFAGSWKYIFTSKALEWVLMKWRKRVNKKLFHPALGGEAMAEL